MKKKNVTVGESEELLCASEDGLIIKYTLTNYPFLLGFRQIKLDKTEGILEGIEIQAKRKFLQAYRYKKNPKFRFQKVTPFCI